VRSTEPPDQQNQHHEGVEETRGAKEDVMLARTPAGMKSAPATTSNHPRMLRPLQNTIAAPSSIGISVLPKVLVP
jgi:hypothetical protein